MIQEMQTALHRLQALPEETQKQLAPRLNEYLNKLDDLRTAIQEGIDSGEPVPAEKIFTRLEAKYETLIAGQQP